jgi:hypothetical protein
MRKAGLPAVFLMILLTDCVWAQLKHGSIIYINRAQDEITMSADSRVASPDRHVDTYCKISAFGPRFVFAMTGIAGENQWDVHSVAREVWKHQSGVGPDNTLLGRTVQGWLDNVEPIYSDKRLIQGVRKLMQVKNSTVPVVASAFFAATDNSGQLRAMDLDIDFDLALFDLTGNVRLIHDVHNVPAGESLAFGDNDTVAEFRGQTTQRAKESLRRFNESIVKLPIHVQRARTAAKYVEWTILFNPNHNELGFPIDILQLRGDGVHWVKRKANCPRY